MAVACGNTFVLKPSEKVSAVRRAGDRAGSRGGLSCRRRQRRHRRSQGRRSPAHPRAGQGRLVRRLDHGGPARLPDRFRGREARAVHGRREELHGHHARRQPRRGRSTGVLGSAFGNTGQRCLAGSVAIAVGDAAEWLLPRFVEAAGKIRVAPGRRSQARHGAGHRRGEPASACRRAIGSGVEEGATLVLDGRTSPATDERVLHRPHHLRPRAPRHANRRRGDLRPRALGHARGDARRRARDDEPLALRQHGGDLHRERLRRPRASRPRLRRA